jgi:uncharacterized protein YeaO (DUF488 family)
MAEEKVLPVYLRGDYNIIIETEVRKRPEEIGATYTGGFTQFKIVSEPGVYIKIGFAKKDTPKEKILLNDISDIEKFEKFIEDTVKREISRNCRVEKTLKSLEIICPSVIPEEELKRKFAKIEEEIKAFSERVKKEEEEEIRRFEEEKRRLQEERKKLEEKAKKNIKRFGCVAYLNGLDCFGENDIDVSFGIKNVVGFPDFRQMIVDKHLREFDVKFDKPVESIEKNGELLFKEPKYFVKAENGKLILPVLPPYYNKKINEEFGLIIYSRDNEMLKEATGS